MAGILDGNAQYLLAKRKGDTNTSFPIKFYRDGFVCGYEWLTRRDANRFHHPLEPNGYVPGGPFITPISVGFTAEQWRKDRDIGSRLMTECRDKWRYGFIDGINAYVLEKNLPFGIINERRW